MGHLVGIKEQYKKLIKKIDLYPIGIIESKEVYEFLQLLYKPDEAEIISRMPLKLTTAERLSVILKVTEEELKEKLEAMAFKGLVFDVTRNGKTYYMPMWSIPGFIEMTLMKVRDDIPQKEIAQVMLEMIKDRKFAEDVFQKDTQFGRTLVDEKAVQDTSEIMPYEIATEVLKDTKKIAVVLCYCRHKEFHSGKKCKYPMEVCMALNTGADFITRRNFGREIDRREALDIIEETSEIGLMHIGDNVKGNLTFICNCCKCCCGILRSYHDHGIFNVAVSSSFVMNVDSSICVGCGRCARRCPMNAIILKPTLKPGELKCIIDENICLGCGICFRACNKGALHLKKREKRLITPETGIEKLFVMALERGKLQNILFDNVYSKRDEFARKFFGIIFKNSYIKKFLLKDDIRRKIIEIIYKNIKKTEYNFSLEL